MQLIDLFRINLSGEDFSKVEVIQLYIDLYNLRALWLNQQFDPRGSFSLEELQNSIATKTGFKDYILDFLQFYDDPKELAAAFPALIAKFFQEESATATGFLKEYLSFERNWRLITAGFRAKQLGKDLMQELQFEDSFDPIIAQLLVQKDAKSYEPPEGYEGLKILFEKYGGSPLDLLKALSQYRIDRIEEIKGDDVFGIGAMLAYLVELLIVERWQEALKEQGLKIIDTIVKGVR